MAIACSIEVVTITCKVLSFKFIEPDSRIEFIISYFTELFYLIYLQSLTYMWIIMAYERGQEVFRSRPFCHMIEYSYRAKICDFCLKFNPEANTKCVDCRFVHYCNKLCQKMAWASYHQQECKYFKKLPCENKTISSPTIGKNIFQKIFDIFHL